MLLLDAFNILHVTGVLPPRLAGLDLDELVDLIRASRYRALPLTLVCDGQPRTRFDDPPFRGKSAPLTTRTAGATFIFAGPGREADAEIERFLSTHSAARRCLVVSSDRRVQRAARRVRARSLRSDAFLAQLVADESRHPLNRRDKGVPDPLPGPLVRQWMEEFGFSPDSSPVEPPPSPPRPVAVPFTESPPDRRAQRLANAAGRADPLLDRDWSDHPEWRAKFGPGKTPGGKD